MTRENSAESLTPAARFTADSNRSPAIAQNDSMKPKPVHTATPQSGRWAQKREAEYRNWSQSDLTATK
eukprot:CAMPEP_0172600290 /NCGR_PEP_ID=MMETSP1068-20121228/20460_1 /TAXON_ID=35684 /ORGANISM="Pseudopedinella elastica, Strain CCMP716" /LENGTH=67 /DNA_ID=CAMNT_0013400883 /DNA_START=207 /DNA_END=411 /DNA_ORIENTATION=-